MTVSTTTDWSMGRTIRPFDRISGSFDIVCFDIVVSLVFIEIFSSTRSTVSSALNILQDSPSAIVKYICCIYVYMYRGFIYIASPSIRCLWSLIEPSSKSRSSPTLQNRSFIAILSTQGGYTSALSHRLQLRVIGKLLAALPTHDRNGQAR